MGYMLCESAMLDIHLTDETLKALTGNRRKVFNGLLIGENLRELSFIEVVGKAVLDIPDDQVITITMNKFIENHMEGQDYRDYTGTLV